MKKTIKIYLKKKMFNKNRFKIRFKSQKNKLIFKQINLYNKPLENKILKIKINKKLNKKMIKFKLKKKKRLFKI